MSRIKICGLRRPEDIAAVNEARPDYCGFIIEFPKSFQGIPITLVAASIVSMSFMGFGGLIENMIK